MLRKGCCSSEDKIDTFADVKLLLNLIILVGGEHGRIETAQRHNGTTASRAIVRTSFKGELCHRNFFVTG